MSLAPPSRQPAEASLEMLEAALGTKAQLLCRVGPERDAFSVWGAAEHLTGRASGEIDSFAALLDCLHAEDRDAFSTWVTASETPKASFRLVRSEDAAVLACEARRVSLGPDVDARAFILERSEAVVGADDADRLSELVDYLPDYVSIHSTDGRCLSMNAAGRRLLGIERGADVGRLGLTDLIADSTSAPAHLLLSVVMAHGSHATEVVMRNRRTGTQIAATWSASVVADERGAARFVVCIVRDMSGQLEIEWRLRQNQRRLMHALDVSRLGEWSMDVATQTSSRSRRAAEIFGYAEPSESWSYRELLAHVHPDDRERVDRAFGRSLESGRDLDFEARIRRRDGESRWISMRGSLNRSLFDSARRIGGVVQDVTERKFTEQRDRFLADVSVPLNTLLDHRSTLEQVARLAVPFLADHCSIDLSTERGELERVVATSTLLEGETVGADAQGKRPPPLLARVLEADEPVLLDVGAPKTLDALARTRAERLSLRALDVRSYLGVPLVLRRRRIGVMHFYRTDTESRYTEKDGQVARELAERVAVALENARLYQALQESDQRKDEFLAMLSHELRNPLESLEAGVSVIESEDSEKQRDWAQAMIRGQITKLSAILEDLLDVSRYTFNKVVLHREEVALGPLLGQSVDEMRGRAEALGYRVELDTGDTAQYIDVDPVRFGQVIGNLLTNAMKYGAERGAIRVEARHDGGEAVVCVSDEGIGLRPEDLSSIFDLFSQSDVTIDRSLGGLGMGLTLVRRIVEMHGGSVVAESAGADRGTRFVIRLPARLVSRAEAEGTTADAGESRPQEELRPPASSGRDASEPPRRLMLVDDNVETVAALQKLFLMKGYEVETAHDGLAALDLAESFEPEAAVLDIGLPGISGYEVASRLRARYGERPLLLVALSGYGQRKDRERSREAGFDHHLLKPANFRSIMALFESA